MVLTNSLATLPVITLECTSAGADGPKIIFKHDSSSPAAADVIGTMVWQGKDSDDQLTTFAQIATYIVDPTGGNEGGKIDFKVATHNGSLIPGLVIEDGGDTNQVNVSISYGSSSVTTVAGDLTITGGNITNAVTFDSGLTGTLTGQADTVASIGNLTGDVTSSNRATTIADDAVTYAKMQNVTATDRILGRDSAGAGVVEEITPANLRTMINVEDGATADQSQADINGLAITTTGALDSGSITSGFGTINNGSSAITTTGTVSGGELQVDDINLNSKTITLTGSTGDTCAIACSTHGATTITTTDATAAQANLSLIADGNIDFTGSIVSAYTDTFDVVSTNTNRPVLQIHNGTNDATGGTLDFFNKRGNAGVDGDVLGNITFTGPNHDGSEVIAYNSIVGSIVESNDTDEAGKLEIKVATSDGSTSANQIGVSLTGNGAENTVDVVIGYGNRSDHTVNGRLSATKRKFTITDNTPGSCDGDVVYFGGEAETLAAGQVVHYNSSGNWELVDPSNSTKSVGLIGIILGSDASVHGVLLRGMVTHDHDPGEVGQALYLKATGDISSIAPTGSGNIVRVVGYCLDASNGQIWFNPDSTYIEI